MSIKKLTSADKAIVETFKNLHNKNLELDVLATLAFAKDLQHEISLLTEDDFYSLDSKEIFNKFLKTYNDNGAIDVSILEAKTYSLMVSRHFTTLSSHLDIRIEELKDLSAKRKIKAITDRAGIMIRENKDSEAIKMWVSSEVAKIDIRNTGLISTQQSEIDEQFMEYIEFENERITRTGFPTLDREIGGFFGGTFTAIGGVPKSGKTTLMLNMVRSACVQGKKVLLVSLEMSENDIQAKLVSRITGIDTRNLRGIAHKNDDKKMRAIMSASAEIAGYNFYRIGRKGVSAADIDNEINNLGGVDIVFIDYLQKLTPTNRKEAKYNQVTQLSNDCSMLALKYDIPVVFVASINRQHVHRSDGRPTPSDFRDSGVIEYDVTSALLLYRNEDEDITELNIALNRYGASQHVMRLKFMPEKSMFGELDLQSATPRRDINGG